MRFISKKDILNGIIGSLVAQTIWVLGSLIWATVKKYQEGTTYAEIWRGVNLWLNQGMNLNITITPLIVLISLVTTLIAIIFVMVKSREPFKWNFEGFLGMNGVGTDTDNPIYEIRSFQASAVNMLDRPVTDISGYIEIDKTGEKFDLKVNKNGQVVDVNDLFSIPTGETLGVCAFFGRNIVDYGSFKGVAPEAFKQRYSPFTFVFSVEGKEYRYKFKARKIDQIINGFTTPKQKRQSGPIYKS